MLFDGTEMPLPGVTDLSTSLMQAINRWRTQLRNTAAVMAPGGSVLSSAWQDTPMGLDWGASTVGCFFGKIDFAAATKLPESAYGARKFMPTSWFALGQSANVSSSGVIEKLFSISQAEAAQPNANAAAAANVRVIAIYNQKRYDGDLEGYFDGFWHVVLDADAHLEQPVSLFHGSRLIRADATGELLEPELSDSQLAFRTAFFRVPDNGRMMSDGLSFRPVAPRSTEPTAPKVDVPGTVEEEPEPMTDVGGDGDAANTSDVPMPSPAAPVPSLAGQGGPPVDLSAIEARLKELLPNDRLGRRQRWYVCPDAGCLTCLPDMCNTILRGRAPSEPLRSSTSAEVSIQRSR